MSAKVKNTVIIFIILVLIVIGGALFNYVYLKGKIEDRQKKIKDMTLFQLDTETLEQQLVLLRDRVAKLDSILSNRKYNVPFNLPQSDFYDFVNRVSFNFSPYSYVNIEYDRTETGAQLNYYVYKLSGVADFNDLNRLIYAIEESKMLKKIGDLYMANNVQVDDDGVPHYLVSFKFTAMVYFSNDDRFYVKDYTENRLTSNPIYDVFYPLIRNEIPPNVEGLLDVQTASLLALIPDGAFLSDANGNTYLLWEGDRVYLGYLTKIDYDNNQVDFLLNKGGIVETVTLKLEKENKKSK
ncbi:hypothetical protein MROS_0594 [Melioribacter roseus P3M-2]|uniref:Uncharacterized protein n=1 Tax=Melioribacter roseus (strain DSM 23840 / JCM 17771 / VKM B-2668 / P3M-2) TaxID=1191523 RepID=I6YTG0_MELRP|nr:hypothetical protein [Melioribacter roseus]AFN73837.1 hypothetical protein MROS_0594 [Melioribacter roseus P3M-2]